MKKKIEQCLGGERGGYVAVGDTLRQIGQPGFDLVVLLELVQQPFADF